MFEEEDEEPELKTVVKKPSFISDFCSAFKKIATNECTKYLLMGGFFRFFGGYTIVFFTPQFYQFVFQDYMSEFSISNALSTMILCFISVFAGGIISDKFNPSNPMIKTWVQVISSLASVPFVVLAYSVPSAGFWFSMENLALNYLFSEAWASPTVTMLLDASPQEAQGLAVNVYLLFSSFAAIISTSAFDYI